MFSFIWWIIGFYWVSTGGQNLTRDSPQLYWFVFMSSSSIIVISYTGGHRLIITHTFSYYYYYYYFTGIVLFIEFDRKINIILFDIAYKLKMLPLLPGCVLRSWHLMCSLWLSALLSLVSLVLPSAAVYRVLLQSYMQLQIR